MGVVYEGYDPIIGRTVAIKTMLAEGLPPNEFQEFKARFQREAQAAGVLTHPNIVTVYDFGEDQGVLYLAMEFLEGKSLERMVQEQNILPIETIVPMYEQVCSALDHAHMHKIVHRDIKPANIMIQNNGLVKVTDFGIAKMMSMGMTQAGQILGTPNYMSPEQVKGRPIDGRSDIFSLGVILYELVTGEKPFGGQNITTVIYKIINENPIPPRELDATIHPGLSYVISKALAKNPDERYQTCRELSEDLKNYRNMGSGAAPSETVIIKIPPPVQVQNVEPQQGPPPATPILDSQPLRPMNVHVIPPPPPAQSNQASRIIWALLGVVLAGGLAAGYYFLFLRKPIQTVQTSTVSQATPSTQTPSPGVAPPATQQSLPAATDQTTTSPAPTTTEQPAQPKPVSAKEPEAAHTTEKPTHAAIPKVGGLLVTSNVQGAAISIDGHSNSGWTTPHTFTDLTTGFHNVSISKNGYSSYQQGVEIQGGHTATLSVQLSTPSGEIDIVTIPPGIEVLIDGKSKGPSPVRETISAGLHTYTINRPGAPYTSSFNMQDGGIIKKTIDLSGGATGGAQGIVIVRTIPPGASVYADGNPIGGQTPTSFRLSAGTHTLTISLSGYKPIREQVTVEGEGSVPVNKTLSPAQ
jgi:serine/threonine protein kinase